MKKNCVILNNSDYLFKEISYLNYIRKRKKYLLTYLYKKSKHLERHKSPLLVATELFFSSTREKSNYI